MIKLLFMLFAILAMRAQGQEQWQHPDAKARVIVNHIGPDPATVMMYSQNRNGQRWGPWPIMGGHSTIGIVITCKLDEYICMGAWTGKATTAWGVGEGQRQTCNNCCFRCDNHGHNWWMRDLDGRLSDGGMAE